MVEADDPIGCNAQTGGGDQPSGRSPEHARGEIAIYHLVHEPRQSGRREQPVQPAGHRDQRPKELTETIPVEPRGRGWETHIGFLRHVASRCNPVSLLPPNLSRHPRADVGDSRRRWSATGSRDRPPTAEDPPPLPVRAAQSEPVPPHAGAAK